MFWSYSFISPNSSQIVSTELPTQLHVLPFSASLSQHLLGNDNDSNKSPKTKTAKNQNIKIWKIEEN